MLPRKSVNYLFWSTLVLLIVILFVTIIQFLTTATTVSYTLEPPIELRQILITEAISSYNSRLTPWEQRTICANILKESADTGLDPLLITSVIAAESSFVPKALSPCAARGLMQISSGVAKWMQVDNPYDIKQNIFAGTHYLKYLFNRFDEYELAIAAYNAGSTRVARLHRVPRINETINYVKKVSLFHTKLRGYLGSLFHNPLNRISLLAGNSWLLSDFPPQQKNHIAYRNILPYSFLAVVLCENRLARLMPI